MAREKKQSEDAEYNPMDTYGDLVTLLLTFFVLLFASSSMDTATWESIVTSFTGSPPKKVITSIDLLDYPNFEEYLPIVSTMLPPPEEDTQGDYVELVTPEGTLLVPEDQFNPGLLQLGMQLQSLLSSEEYQEVEEDFDKLYETLRSYIEANGIQDMLQIDRDTESIYLNVTAGILFDSGSAKLLPDYLPVLDELEALMASAQNGIGTILVEGHTDTDPIKNARFEDNRELSSARANSVARYMESKGNLSHALLVGTGYGEYHPIADNSTEAGKQQNRRVQFVIKKKIITFEEVGEP